MGKLGQAMIKRMHQTAFQVGGGGMVPLPPYQTITKSESTQKTALVARRGGTALVNTIALILNP